MSRSFFNMLFSGREKLRKKQFDFASLRAHDSETIVPEVRVVDHGERLKTVCILDEGATS